MGFPSPRARPTLRGRCEGDRRSHWHGAHALRQAAEESSRFVGLPRSRPTHRRRGSRRRVPRAPARDRGSRLRSPFGSTLATSRRSRSESHRAFRVVRASAGQRDAAPRRSTRPTPAPRGFGRRLPVATAESSAPSWPSSRSRSRVRRHSTSNSPLATPVTMLGHSARLPGWPSTMRRTTLESTYAITVRPVDPPTVVRRDRRSAWPEAALGSRQACCTRRSVPGRRARVAARRARCARWAGRDRRS